MNSSGRFPSILAIITVILLITVGSSAQVTKGELQGIVFDPNKALVQGAKVTITNVATGQARETVTNTQGFYRVTNLEPGINYKIEVSAAGFAGKTVNDVRVMLAAANDVDIVLGLASTQEVVQVNGEAVLLDTSSSELSTQYTVQQLTQLPYNGGAIDNLALLTPGVLSPGDSSFSNGVGISANGNRGRSNSFQIDGQDNNDNSVAGPALTLTNTEAVGAFQVVTNAFSAEFGRNSGAQINVVTKSGTNQFHGSVFEYLANSALNSPDNLDKRSQANYNFLASNGFSDFSGLARRSKDPFTSNRFGGAIGGPIKSNKAFFFVTYQGDRQRGESTINNLGSGQVTFTPQSAALAAQLFPNAATQALTSTAIGGGPAFVKGVGQLLIAPPLTDTNGDGKADAFVYGPNNPFGLTPTPNMLSDGLYVNVNGVPTPLYFGEAARLVRNDVSEDQVITRLDYNITDKDILSGRYIYDNSRFPLATGSFVAGAIFDVPSNNNNLGLTYTRTISSRIVNEARFNFSRLNVRFGDPNANPLPGPGIQFGGVRDLNSDGSLSFGTPNTLPQSRKVDVYQFQDTITATLGTHGLKFGPDIRLQKVQNFFLPNFLGVDVFNSGGTIPAGSSFVLPDGTPRDGSTATAFENFLLGRPRDIRFALGSALFNTTQNDYFFFLQDDWRVKPTLTLHLGARYEVSTQPLNPLIDQINAREANPSTAIFNPAFDLSTRTATKIPTDSNNISPRIGFAWSPNINKFGSRFSNGKFVLRGGFGIAYDPSFFNIVLNTVTAAPYAAAGIVRQTPGGPGAVSFPFLPNSPSQLTGTPGTNGGDPRLFSQTGVDPNFRNPYTMSYNLGIQQELTKNSVLEIRYVGSRIVDQFQTVNGNPSVQYLNQAAQCLGMNPGAFSNGIVVGSPAATAQDACDGVGFDNSLDANGNPTNGNGRINPNFGPVRTRINGASATYNGLQVRFDNRLARSLTLNATYTFSKTFDNASEIFSTGAGGQSVANSQQFFNITNGERGLSAFDQRHNFTANIIYDFPFYRAQQGKVGKLLGGYRMSSIMLLGSGRAYTPVEAFGTYDPSYENGLIGIGALRPFNGNPSAPNGTIAFGYFAACQVLFGCNDPAAQPGTFIVYNTLKSGSQGTVVPNAQAAMQQARMIYNDFGIANQFGASLSDLEAFQAFGTPYGNVGRNTFSGLPFYQVNMALFKTTNITERMKLELRVEASNILNHRNYGVPDAFTEDAFSGSAVSSFQNPGFNNGSQRELRLGMRFLF